MTRFCDETDFGFGWIASEKPRLQLASHALADEGKVWLVDPTLAPLERVRELGEPAGVIQLLDRHSRACAEVAALLGVSHHVVPRQPIAGAPFEFTTIVDRRGWRETALWWPQRRVLVAADALGTVDGYFRVEPERLGVHPLLRLTPPRELRRHDPAHVLVGHGEGVHDGAAEALETALDRPWRRIPRLLIGLPRAGLAKPRA
jgi:hypothetical protein